MSEPFVIEQKQADSSYVPLIGLGYYNRNELHNPYFINPYLVNQRGVTGTISSSGYFIDRWKLVSGSVTITSNGLTLNGSMSQILPSAIGTSYSATVNMFSGSATITYDNSTSTCTITSSGGTIKWAKLEIGAVATPFVPKTYGEELSECIRYYQKVSIRFTLYGNAVSGTSYTFNIPYYPMRVKPTITPSVQYISGATNPQSVISIEGTVSGSVDATANTVDYIVVFGLSADL